MSNQSLDIEEVMTLSKSEDEKAHKKLLFLRRIFSTVICCLACICLLLTYMTLPIDTLRERYQEYENTWKDIIIVSFIFGVNATENTGNYSFTYQCLGYLVIFLFCIIERKAQLWLKERFRLEEELDLNLLQEDEMSREDSVASQDLFDKIPEEKSGHEDSKESINTHKYSLNFQDEDEVEEENKNIMHSLDNLNNRGSVFRVFEEKHNEPLISKSKSEKEFNIAEDKGFKRQVTEMLRIKYKVGFMKAISSILYTIIILLLLLCIIFNCNALSVILFISVAFT